MSKDMIAVFDHFKLPPEVRSVAMGAASQRPMSAYVCYRAIAHSLEKE